MLEALRHNHAFVYLRDPKRFNTLGRHEYKKRGIGWSQKIEQDEEEAESKDIASPITHLVPFPRHVQVRSLLHPPRTPSCPEE